MKNVLNKLVSVAFLGLAFQAYGHDSKVTAEDIELAIKLGQQREACYRKLDKAPNDDYAVLESELSACMSESVRVMDRLQEYAVSSGKMTAAEFHKLTEQSNLDGQKGAEARETLLTMATEGGMAGALGYLDDDQASPDIKVLLAVVEVVKRVERSSDDLSIEVSNLAHAARELAAAYGVSSIDPAVIALDASLTEQQEFRVKQQKGVSNER